MISTKITLDLRLKYSHALNIRFIRCITQYLFNVVNKIQRIMYTLTYLFTVTVLVFLQSYSK